MLVYRIEKNGAGPYASYFADTPFKRALSIHNKCNRHPGIRDIRLRDGEDISNFVFAFKSFEQHRRWFHRRFTALHSEGFKLFVYDIHEEDIRYGDYQIVFKTESELPRRLIGVYNVVGPLPNEVKDLINGKVSCKNVENVEKVLRETTVRYAKTVESLSRKLTSSAMKDVKSSPNDCKQPHKNT